MTDFNRIMDIAVLRDGDIEHTGESLMIACLMHVKPRTKRGEDELTEIRRVMRDHNLD